MSDQLRLFRQAPGGRRRGPHDILVDYLWRRSSQKAIVNHVQRLTREQDYFAAHRLAPPSFDPLGIHRDAEWACWYDAMLQREPNGVEFNAAVEHCQREFPLAKCSRFLDLLIPAVRVDRVELHALTDDVHVGFDDVTTIVSSPSKAADEAVAMLYPSLATDCPKVSTLTYIEHMYIGVEVKPTRFEAFEDVMRCLHRYSQTLTDHLTGIEWERTNRLTRIEIVLVTGYLPTKNECSQLSHAGYRLFYAIPSVTH